MQPQGSSHYEGKKEFSLRRTGAMARCVDGLQIDWSHTSVMAMGGARNYIVVVEMLTGARAHVRAAKAQERRAPADTVLNRECGVAGPGGLQDRPTALSSGENQSG